MQRREFIVALIGIAIVWPFVAGAQQQQPMPEIGLLSCASSSDYSNMIEEFRKAQVIVAATTPAAL
jgi:hypothetical protein